MGQKYVYRIASSCFVGIGSQRVRGSGGERGVIHVMSVKEVLVVDFLPRRIIIFVVGISLFRLCLVVGASLQLSTNLKLAPNLKPQILFGLFI